MLSRSQKRNAKTATQKKEIKSIYFDELHSFEYKLNDKYQVHNI